ncbi:hypothetical protein Tco_0445462 [Tanacetum coccineum]
MRNKVALKATIIVIVERNNKQRPIINRLSNLLRKSFSEIRAVKSDKNTNNAVVDENSEIASDAAKMVKEISFLNNGMPVSSLLPPGTVIAAANSWCLQHRVFGYCCNLQHVRYALISKFAVPIQLDSGEGSRKKKVLGKRAFGSAGSIQQCCQLEFP